MRGKNKKESFFIDLSQRIFEQELMEQIDGDSTKLLATVSQFRWINMFFARYKSLLNTWIICDMKKDPNREYHLVDIGAGGCDIPVWLLEQCAKLKIRLRITALDLDNRIVQWAKNKYGKVEGLTILKDDAFNLKNYQPIDYLFSNHFLHHLQDNEIIRLFKIVDEIVLRRYVFSDHLRSYWAFYSFTILARFLFRDSFAYNDGRISIRKGFRIFDLKNYVTQFKPKHSVFIKTFVPARIAVIGCKQRISEGNIKKEFEFLVNK